MKDDKQVLKECLQKVIQEAKDEAGNEINRVKRFWNRFKLAIKAGARQYVMLFRIWLWPSYLWSDAVNICKLIARFGTRQNESLKIDLLRLLRAAGDGRFKTAKEFTHAKQELMAKYNLRKQRLYDHKEISVSSSEYLQERRSR